LLIGFWFQRPSAAAAAKKAFIVTRLGDLGFLVGILLVYLNTGSLSFSGAEEKMATLGAGLVTAIAALLFCGAIGKSAQFPLHVWLPDAMEGPTPVSALIHAATMVAAGVYMVARLFPIFSQSKDAMLLVAAIGGFTALLAATLGLVAFDIKRVMAYSTISQLGYMMLGLGAGGLAVGIFHLFNHGFFKALLFLTAGSCHHSTHTFDMRYMGGLRRYMPITYWTIVIASLSLAGIFPLSGFWSKDEVLAQVFHHKETGFVILFWMAILAAFMTAFYSFRMIFMTFHGEYRGGAAAEAAAASGHNAGHGSAHGQASHDAHGHDHHLHESPPVMTVPLMILAVLSICSGYILQSNHFFANFMGEHPEEMNMTVAMLSTVVALAGIVFAYIVYQAKWISAQSIGRAFGPIYHFVYNKYMMDVLYENIIAAGLLVWIGKVLDLFDMRVVDGIVDGVGKTIRGTGGYLRRVETGQLQTYALAIFAGVVIIIGYLALGPKG
jgi:NADH-quinone oxidoreductase subunit L